MEKFKDLNVPEFGNGEFLLRQLQSAFCTDAFVKCEKTKCEDCIFYDDNFKEFKEWYNNKLK